MQTLACMLLFIIVIILGGIYEQLKDINNNTKKKL